MKDEFEMLISSAGEDAAGFTDEERARLRALLSEYAAFRPVRAGALGSHARIRRYARPLIAGAAALSTLLLGTGAAAYAAEGTLPGDTLYPLKVDVTEPVITALTPSGKAQVAWQITIARRRLKEAETLSLEGRLATSTEAMLSAQAADATLKGALGAVSLDEASTTVSASTTETIGEVSQLFKEGQGRLKHHDAAGATQSFQASMHAAATLEVLTQTAGTLEVDGSEDDSGSTTSEEASSTPLEEASSSPAAVIKSIIRINHDDEESGDEREADHARPGK